MSTPSIDMGAGPAGLPRRARQRARRVWRVWRLARIPLIALFGLLAAGMSALFVAVYAFPYDGAALAPDSGGPLVITDRNGVVLRSVPASDGRPGRENWVLLADMPATAVMTVIASEDQDFYRHRGVDGLGVMRAAWLDLERGRMAFGGSTITMQLARMLHSAGQERSAQNKVKEAVLALRMERALDKRTILENYLNRAYYGNGAYGIEAAARLYFGKPAASLSLGEATLLAIVPRAPTGYDPLVHLDRALARRDHVLDMLVARQLVSADTADRARAQPVAPARHDKPFRAAHFVDWVLDELPEEVRRRGGVVRTTLDIALQEELERRVAEHVATMQRRNVQQAGVVVLDTATGEILAMVGSADYRGRDGQVNITTRRRHPGSALKPFIYALAIEGGASPASIAYDIYDDDPGFRVVNRSQPEHGPVRYREALAGSYNMAAIDVLRRSVGVERLMSTLRRAGVGALEGSPEEYGLRLALGSAKVRLIDLGAAYRFLVRDGKASPAVGVIEARSDAGATWRPPLAQPVQVVSPESAWLVMDMLADPEARRKVFGQELPVDLPYNVAVKTGTARGFADTVAVGVTREFTVAAWAGNFDGTPSEGLVAMESAAPLLRAGLLHASRGRMLTLPERPEGIESRDVCPLSGLSRSPACPHTTREFFKRGQTPDPSHPCDWHRVEDGELVVRYPDAAAEWAERQRTRGGKHL